MAQYYCPLCKQAVSRALYEKITGVWQEKEERLADLKAKEKKLLQKEREMRSRFSEERLKIIGAERKRLASMLGQKEKRWKAALAQEREALRTSKEAAEASYRRKLSRETQRILREGREKARDFERSVKLNLQSRADKTIERERKILTRAKNALQRQEKVQMNKYGALNKQYGALQHKSKLDQEKATRKILALEEQLKQDKTPQVLGLLEEGIFLEKLTEAFPVDRFEHPGKGGDIVHHIMDKNTEIGAIVYELKKVNTFNKNHISQAFEAKQVRNADYGILVTNAKRSKEDFGLSVAKGVIIIHPAGALVLVNIIRDHVIRIAKLKLSAAKRSKTLQAVLDYIQGPTFRNGIEAIIEDTKELYFSLTKEVRDHIKSWELRINKYRDIQSGAHVIDSKVVRLLDEGADRRSEIIEAEIVPIALPPKID